MEFPWWHSEHRDKAAAKAMGCLVLCTSWSVGRAAWVSWREWGWKGMKNKAGDGERWALLCSTYHKSYAVALSSVIALLRGLSESQVLFWPWVSSPACCPVQEQAVSVPFRCKTTFCLSAFTSMLPESSGALERLFCKVSSACIAVVCALGLSCCFFFFDHCFHRYSLCTFSLLY